MYGTIFASSKKRETLKKVFAGFMALTLNLSLGGVASILTSNVAYAKTVDVTPSVTIDTINGNPLSQACLASPVTIAGSGQFNPNGNSQYHIEIIWSNGSVQTGIPVVMNANGHSFTFSTTTSALTTSTSTKVVLYHGSIGGQDFGVETASIAIATCIAPPTTAVITVKKHVINNSGGVSTASNFTLHMKQGSTDVTGSSFLGSETGTDFILLPNTYSVSENAFTGYTQTGVSCVGNGATTTNGSLTTVAGKNYTCTITNDDNVPPPADTTPPQTTIITGPTGTMSATTAAFTFTSNEAGTFTCTLDAGASTTCVSGISFSSLSNGPHTFRVYATDLAGNSDATPDSRTWTVDTIPPTVTIVTPTTGQTTGPTGVIHSTVSDGTVTCTLDGGPAACDGSGSYSYSGLTSSHHTFVVTAVDAVGNTGSASVTWIVDATAPVVTIVSPTSAATTPASGTIIYTTGDAVSVTCTLDSAPVACDLTGSYAYSTLTNGSHTFTVTATDAVGNPGSASVTWNVVIPQTLTVVVSGAGSVTGTGISCPGDCSESYSQGTTVTLAATPATGSTFAGWSGACTGTGTCVVTLTSASTVTATFTLTTRTLSVTTTGPGSVTSSPAGITCGVICSGIFDFGTMVTLTPTPSLFSTFVGWTGDCSGPTCSISMDSARSVTATFTAITENTSTTCSDNVDNDGDNLIDLSDPDCAAFVPVDVCPNDEGVQISLTQCTPIDPVCTDGQQLVNHVCVTPAPVCNPDVNLLANASFEAPALSNPSWTIVPFTNAALKWLGAFVNPLNTDNLGLEVQNHVAGSPADGAQFAELDGYHPTAIYQNVPTIAGDDYVLSFKYSPRPGTVVGNNVLEVRKDGSVLGTQISRGSTSSDTEWTNESRTFQATGSTTKVEFADMSASDDGYGTYIDGASLTCVGPHAPTDTKGHLIIKKIANGGDDTFDFTVDSHLDGPATNASISTEDGLGMTQTIDLIPGTTTVTELTKIGWNFNEVSCVYENQSVGEIVPQNPRAHDVFVEAGDTVTCTYTNSKVEVPACVATPQSFDRNSNELLSFGDGHPVLVDFDSETTGQQVHSGWTASISGAQWIWGENPVSTPGIDQTESFFDVFLVVGTPTGATLDIAADNTYEVYLNNVKVGESVGGLDGLDWNNFQSNTQDNISIPADKFVTGSNTLEVRVMNVGVPNSDGQSNPAGLLYNLHVNYNTICEQPPVECPSGQHHSGESCVPNVIPDSPPGGGGGSSSFDYWGCTNPAAVNFNPLANKDDGSCHVLGDNNGNHQGGGNNGNGGGNGEVLGAATTTEELPLPAACAANPYLRDYLKLGKKNDVDQVKLLQTFLNEVMSANLPVSGFFGNLTKTWVKKFQKTHNAEIIQPWIDAGFSPRGLKDGTGYVYKTTKRAINLMKCNAATIPMPDLTPDIGN